MKEPKAARGPMQAILDYPVKANRACLWFLGQSGFVIRCCETTVVIDPYLSDSVGKLSPSFSRAIPVPVAPRDLRADIFIVTHDHLDHLDPETIGPYRHKADTIFVGPRLVCRKLGKLGVPAKNIIRVDSGESAQVKGVQISGVYAIPNGPDAVDTAGYFLRFPNGRTLYHTSDTGYSELLVRAAPKCEALLACINGKWNNLNAEQAAELAARVAPKIAIPHHYDVMALNSENPRTFEFFVHEKNPGIKVHIPVILEPFTW